VGEVELGITDDRSEEIEKENGGKGVDVVHPYVVGG
jgi:hypothetical protein